LTGDWGAQLGWVSVDVHGAVPALRLNRLAVFQTDAGDVTFGMPLLRGEFPGSRYSGITFDTNKQFQRFLKRLGAALRTARPDRFARQRQSSPQRDSDLVVGGDDPEAAR
jgi:hypothetical protein